jgi:hypothetical protein
MSHENKTIEEVHHKEIYHCDICNNPDRDGPQIIDHYEWEETNFRTCIVCHKDFCQVCYKDHRAEYNYLITEALENDRHPSTLFVCRKCISIINDDQEIQNAIKGIIESNKQMEHWTTEKWKHFNIMKDKLLKF